MHVALEEPANETLKRQAKPRSAIERGSRFQTKVVAVLQEDYDVCIYAEERGHAMKAKDRIFRQSLPR
jgi:hypothetical protein